MSRTQASRFILTAVLAVSLACGETDEGPQPGEPSVPDASSWFNTGESDTAAVAGDGALDASAAPMDVGMEEGAGCSAPFLPCSCDDALGWAPCEEGQPTDDCRCDGLCPGSDSSSAEGQLQTTLASPFLGLGALSLTHRLATGDWSCLTSATLRFSAEGQQGDGCALEVEASAELGPNGGLRVISAVWDADALCLGLSETARGRYLATELGTSELVFEPATTPGGRDAECWTGVASLTIEGLFEREDGAVVTVSPSTLTLSTSVISQGTSASCAQPVLVDINACPTTVPDGSSCNPYCQLGCSQGEHCIIDNGFFTCAVAGPTSFGQPCGDATDCAFGLSCLTLPGDPQPICHKPCSSSEDCPVGAQCAITANLGAGQSLQLCGTPTETCDLFEPEACEGELSCYYDGPASQCLPPGVLGPDTLCEGQGPNACAPGLACLVSCQALCSDGSGAQSCALCPQGAHVFDPQRGLGICLGDGYPATCDPYTQVGCGAGEGCYPVAGGVSCRQSGGFTEGESCSVGSSCQAGLVCVGTIDEDSGEQQSRCLPLCDHSGTAPLSLQCSARCPDSFGLVEPILWGIGVCYPE